MNSHDDSFEHDSVFNALRRPERYFDMQYTPQYATMDFARLQLTDVVLNLLLNTAAFRPKARSYRDFKVAAGAFAIGEGTVGRVLGFNAKFDATDRVNIHAEDLVVAKAQEAGFDAISVLAVIGPTQEDHASGKSMPTLHPCGRCRDRLSDNDLMKNDTLVVMARPDFTAIEVGSMEQIRTAHSGGEQLQMFTYDTTPEVFIPPVPNERGFLEPIEVDDTDWQSSMGSFLINRYGLRLLNSSDAELGL